MPNGGVGVLHDTQLGLSGTAIGRIVCKSQSGAIMAFAILRVSFCRITDANPSSWRLFVHCKLLLAMRHAAHRWLATATVAPTCETHRAGSARKRSVIGREALIRLSERPWNGAGGRPSVGAR